MYFNQIINVFITYFNQLFNDKNFMFEFQCLYYLNDDENIFIHVVNSFFYFVQIYNITITSIKLPRRAKRNIVMKYN